MRCHTPNRQFWEPRQRSFFHEKSALLPGKIVHCRFGGTSIKVAYSMMSGPPKQRKMHGGR
jgi:hypothetical protein